MGLNQLIYWSSISLLERKPHISSLVQDGWWASGGCVVL